ncbi:MAG TPA: GNAT family N-acetyltransferase [Gryllotalpicola sp.]
MPDEPVALRPFTAADRATLIAWVADADELYRFSGGSLEWPLDDAQLDRIEATSGITSWTAVNADGAPFGHLDLVCVGPAQARIARVLIAPAFRGRGLARPMIAEAVRMLHAEGVHEVALHLVPGNAPALRAYAGVGFTIAPPTPGRPEFVRMELHLD